MPESLAASYETADHKLDQDEVEELEQRICIASEADSSGSSVFDASAMSPLSPASVKALARLRAYSPPLFHTWNELPLSRRAAVLLLLFADRHGDLRVVITMRASSLRHYSGHAALPGGKADSLAETPFQIARREAYEEIGLPFDDGKLPPPFRIEHICQLPFSLAKTELVVRPCVAFLHSESEATDAGAAIGGTDGSRKSANVEETMIPRLDAKEVAAVFSAPFHNFLRDQDELREGGSILGKREDWYQGSWSAWHGKYWRVHNFYVPINNQVVTKPRVRESGQKSIAEQPEEDEETANLMRYKVWGMTARILVDAARVAYGEEPTFEHNTHFGDEELIEQLHNIGRLEEKKQRGLESTQNDPLKAVNGAKM